MSEPYIAEVIESSTTEFAAQCRQLHGAPPFGSFVKVTSPLPILAMIYDVSTGSADVNRRPIAYGKTEEELRQEQPQIFELLRTEIKAKIVGYIADSRIHQMLPPQPPNLHTFVYTCTPEEICTFTERFDYFRMLNSLGGVLADELLIAAVRQTCAARDTSDRTAFIRAGKELARLLRDDYDRLESILRRITE
jgi:hypothetical protein